MKPPPEAASLLRHPIPAQEFHCIKVVDFRLAALDDGHILGVNIVVNHGCILLPIDFVNMSNTESHHYRYLQLDAKELLVVVALQLPREGLKVGKALEEVGQLINRRLTAVPINIDYIGGWLIRQVNFGRSGR